MMAVGGYVQTVLGPVEPSSLGVVMPHEHLFVDLTCMFDPPTEASDRSRAFAPFSLEHLGWIRRTTSATIRTSTSTTRRSPPPRSASTRRPEARRSSTCHARNRPRPARARAARAPDGSERRHGHRLLRRLDAPAEVADDERGRTSRTAWSRRSGGGGASACGGGDQDWDPLPNRTGVRAGIIKAAATYPLHPEERKVLRAAAWPSGRPVRRSRCTSAGTRTPRSRSSSRCGTPAPISPAAHSTTSTSGSSERDAARIAESGCLLEFDMFGHESSYYPLTAATCRATRSAWTSSVSSWPAG